MPDKTQDAQLNFKLFKIWVYFTCYMEHILGKIYTYMSPQITRDTLTLERFIVGAHLKLRASWSPSFSLALSGSPSLHSWGLPECPQPRCTTQTLRALGEPGEATLSTQDFLSPHVTSCPHMSFLSPRVTSCPVWLVCTWCLTLFAPRWLSLGLLPDTLRAGWGGRWVGARGALGIWRPSGRVGGEVNQVSSLLAAPNNDPVALTQGGLYPCTSQRSSLLGSIEVPQKKAGREAYSPRCSSITAQTGRLRGKPFSPGQAGHPSPAPEAPVTRSRGAATCSVSGWHLHNDRFPSFP